MSFNILYVQTINRLHLLWGGKRVLGCIFEMSEHVFLFFFINNMMKNVYSIICYALLDSWYRLIFFLIVRILKLKHLFEIRH